MSDQYIGTIVAWAPNFAPRGWAFCNGQMLQISQYQAVYSLLGNTYGGDGINNFALPDLRGRVPLGAGHGPGLNSYLQGAMGGVETVTVTTAQMPSHTHAAGSGNLKVAVPAVSGDATTTTPGAGVHLATVAETNRGHQTTNIYSNAAPNTTLGGDMTVTGDIVNDVTGGGLAHENRQPYQVVQYIICLEGIFPPRS